jgi:hypothetical protein
MHKRRVANCYEPLQTIAWQNPEFNPTLRANKFCREVEMTRGRPVTREQIIVERRPQLRRMAPSGPPNGTLDIDTGARPTIADVWPKRPEISVEPTQPEPEAEIETEETDTDQPTSRRRDPARMEAEFEVKAETRVGNILDALDALKILSDRARYRSHPDQIIEIRQALMKALTETMAAFDEGTGSKRTFRLKTRRHR